MTPAKKAENQIEEEAKRKRRKTLGMREEEIRVHDFLSSLLLFCSLGWFSEEIETENQEQRATGIHHRQAKEGLRTRWWNTNQLKGIKRGNNSKRTHLNQVANALLPLLRSHSAMLNRMNKLGEKAGNFAHGLREHVRLGRSLAETVKGKLRLGARILKVGGSERFFKSLFRVPEEEKLLKASQCYLSTTDGPIAGLLFISTNSVSFWSERSLKIPSPNGELLRLHYKVFIPLKKIRTVVLCENVKKQSTKYIQITTSDNYDFWFMGFLNYQKAMKYLQLTIYEARKK